MTREGSSAGRVA